MHFRPRFEAWIATVMLLTATQSVRSAQDMRLEFSAIPFPAPLKVQVTRLDFLISGLALRKQDGTWVDSRDWFAFISSTGGKMTSDATGTPNGDYSAIRFRIGVDEATNKADPNSFHPDHALNPLVNNLHWGWQGGFIFMALEGRRQEEAFSYHIANAPQLMTIELPVEFHGGGPLTIGIDFDLSKTLQGITESTTHSREGDETAARLKTNIEKAFSVRKVSYDVYQRPLAVKNATVTPAISQRFPQATLPTDNPLTEAGIELGRQIFNDKRLSSSNSQSCAACHEQGKAFADARRFSLGAQQQVGKRNAMPLFNLAWHSAFFWDGRAATLREQVLMPIQDKAEMNETLPNVIAKLSVDSGETFRQAFGTPEITAERIAKALEQYLLTLISQESKFDRATRKLTDLTEAEKRGLQLFVTEFDPRRGLRGADCFHCHGGMLFSSQQFANNGLKLSADDIGRMAVTKSPADLGKFKTPSLRNVALTAPYMHDGRFSTLEEVIEHYDHGLTRSDTLDPNLAKHPAQGLQLTAQEKSDLVSFLRTLTDDEFTAAPKTLSQAAN